MICPNCGTNIEDNAEECEYCGANLSVDEEKRNEQMYEKTESQYVTGKNPSLTNIAVGFIVGLIIILAIVFGIVLYQNYEKNKIDKKYSEISDNYGLTDMEIENNISSYYYKTWYMVSGDTLTITEDEMIYNKGEEKDSYKVTRIYRSSNDEIFTMIIFCNGKYGRIEPYTKRNYAGEKEYDYIKVYDGASGDGEHELLYDRPSD